MDALAFIIEAPLASWGGRLAGTVRTSDAIPTHSALMGMVGAALGLPRGDDELTRLTSDYASATWVVNGGERMSEFHTVETPISTGFVVARPRTRADELMGATATTITRREYMMDVRYVSVLKPAVENPVFTLDILAGALEHPVYTLSAGRRSCSLSSPLVPVPLIDDDLEHFLSLATVWDARIETSVEGHSIRRRTDMLVSASKRRFMAREEVVR